MGPPDESDYGLMDDGDGEATPSRSLVRTAILVLAAFLAVCGLVALIPPPN